ncbi:MAG TPA: SPOR domain-containing protein [Burkholderiaceae bacterium]|jgi:cell division protein FtsN
MNHKNESQRGGFKGQRGGFKGQRGGFAVGLIIGLLIGLALALGVALYVTKVPVPFVNKVPQRNPNQDAAEAEKNKNWDPNSPLYGKNPAKPNSAASEAPAVTTAPTPVIPGMPSTTPPANSSAAVPAARASGPVSTRDPAAILADRPARGASAVGGGANDPFTYFVQAGAYGRTEDAEAQRAKIALLGMDAKLTEREQSGKTVYRVRVGPFDKRADADAAKSALDSAGVEAALVRVQRSGTP